jgi:hypothetical protein
VVSFPPCYKVGEAQELSQSIDFSILGNFDPDPRCCCKLNSLNHNILSQLEHHPNDP